MISILALIASSGFIRLHLPTAHVFITFLFGNKLKQIPTRLFFSLVNVFLVDLAWQRRAHLLIDDNAFERETHSLSATIDLEDAVIRFKENAFCSCHNSNNNTGGIVSSTYVKIQLLNLKDAERLDFNSCLSSDYKFKHPNYCTCGLPQVIERSTKKAFRKATKKNVNFKTTKKKVNLKASQISD